MISCLKKNKHEPETNALTALSAEDWKSLIALSDMQRITPLLWHRLKQKGLDHVVPDAVAVSLHESTRRNTLHNLRFNRELCLLLNTLEAENIPLIPLKGIVLANKIYENIGLREMNDIDVLARRDDIMRIADILSRTGYSPIAPLCADVTIQTGIHLPRMIKKGHVNFEIHWNLTLPGKSYYIDPHGLWQRAVPTKIAGTQTMMFSSEDLLLHICLHTSYHHHFAFGLRPFCDIAEIIDHFSSTLDWQTVVNRACHQRWQKGVYLALRLAVELADASVPMDALSKLRPENMSETIFETARAQIFTDKYFVTSIPMQLSKLLASRRLSDKLRIFCQRIFPPRVQMANAYSVPINSIRIYGCYFRRFYDLLNSHSDTFRKIQNKDSNVRSMVVRKKIIADWLE